MTLSANDTQRLVSKIAAEFSALPEVRAVVLAGSRSGKFFDGRSDIDLFVYAEPEPREAWRTSLAEKFGEQISIGNHFWETGDEWVVSGTDTIVDIMYRSPAWIEEQFDRTLVRHQASLGYSTCLIYNVQHSQPLFDRNEWFAALQVRAIPPYPESLRRAIVAKNHPVLRGKLSSYADQIALAAGRNDRVSVNHRIAALLASYFDILFAVNHQYHPGEKRLVTCVQANCPKRPPDFELHVNELLACPHTEVPKNIGILLDGLDALLTAEGLLPG
jgi:predicted nucleotidyltransferase